MPAASSPASVQSPLAEVTGDTLRVITGLFCQLPWSIAGSEALLRSTLYEVSPFDPLSFAAVARVLAAISALACWLPTRRAARVEPIVAMRAE